MYLYSQWVRMVALQIAFLSHFVYTPAYLPAVRVIVRILLHGIQFDAY